MVKFADGVDRTAVAPALWLVLNVVDMLHRIVTDEDLVVISLRRPSGPRASPHSPADDHMVSAADLQRRALDEAYLTAPFCRFLQFRLGTWIEVVLDPEWLTLEQLAEHGGAEAVAPHIHLELAGDWWRSLL